MGGKLKDRDGEKTKVWDSEYFDEEVGDPWLCLEDGKSAVQHWEFHW